MSDFKTCKQCGELKPLEQFRHYYGGRSGHYTTCLMCERINSRHKYLQSKDPTNPEREAIELLWDKQRAAGLQPPRITSGRSTPILDVVSHQLGKYEIPCDSIGETRAAPPELSNWTTCELTQDPEFYLDDVFEALVKKYRPLIRIDTSTMLPVHDNTYKDVLDVILARFNDYEDKYYNE